MIHAQRPVCNVIDARKLRSKKSSRSGCSYSTESTPAKQGLLENAAWWNIEDIRLLRSAKIKNTKEKKHIKSLVNLDSRVSLSCAPWAPSFADHLLAADVIREYATWCHLILSWLDNYKANDISSLKLFSSINYPKMKRRS